MYLAYAWAKAFKEMSKLCTVKNATQIMVCDASRDVVEEVVRDQFGDDVSIVTVSGEGTAFTCLNPTRTMEFQHRVFNALGRTKEEVFTAPHT